MRNLYMKQEFEQVYKDCNCNGVVQMEASYTLLKLKI